MKNVSLKDVVLQGGKVNDPIKARNKVEKLWEGKKTELSGEQRSNALKEVHYSTWFELFSVKYCAYFLLPFLTAMGLAASGLVDFANVNLGFSLNIPFLGTVSAEHSTVNWLLTSASFIIFALLLKKIKDDGSMVQARANDPEQYNKLYNGLYDSEILKRLVWFYLNTAEFFLLIFAWFAWVPIFGMGVFVFISKFVAVGAFDHIPFNPLIFLVLMGSGMVFHYLFIPPERPDRRKFGLSKDFKEYIAKDSYIPYRHYGEKPRDLVPSITFYVLFTFKIVATLVLNILLWSFNRFQLKKGLVVFYPVAWLYDFIELMVLDLTFYTINLVNYILGWVFRVLAFITFLGGVGFNTYRMYMLKQNFTIEGLLINLGLVVLTFIIFSHFYHTSKFFKSVDEWGVRKPLSNFFRW